MKPAAGEGLPCWIPVQFPTDAAVASSLTSRVCHTLGFGKVDCEQVAIAVSELATNLVRHAGGGELVLTWRPPVLEVVSRDHGPGFADMQAALRPLEPEVVPQRGQGLHQGLAAVRRLMDDLEIQNHPEGGALVRMTKRLRS